MAPTIHELFDLTGRTALITGGAGFLGKQHASALAEAGAQVVLWDISPAALDAAKKELSARFPGKIDVREVDISNQESVAAAAREIERQHGGLQILINNAGMTVARGQEKFK